MEKRFSTFTVEGGRTRDLRVDLDELAPNRRLLLVSGRLDALVLVQTTDATAPTPLAPYPLHFHVLQSSGATQVYGEEVLRREYRSGDINRLIDPRENDLNAVLEVVQVPAPSAQQGKKGDSK
jgi:hypothetical protein